MVDSLKTFNEGEYIYASETNSNNQYLLSKLSDNAAQVQTYVEGEISSIQSNIASIQATLQANIDETNTMLSTLKNSIFSAIAPNYSKGVKIGAGTSYTAPSFGWVYWTGDTGQGPVYLKINGVNRLSAGATSSEDHINVVLPFFVSKGDKITPDSDGSGARLGTTFYPCKGFN